jgi:hypothetical protein
MTTDVKNNLVFSWILVLTLLIYFIVNVLVMHSDL